MPACSQHSWDHRNQAWSTRNGQMLSMVLFQCGPKWRWSKAICGDRKCGNISLLTFDIVSDFPVRSMDWKCGVALNRLPTLFMESPILKTAQVKWSGTQLSCSDVILCIWWQGCSKYIHKCIYIHRVIILIRPIVCSWKKLAPWDTWGKKTMGQFWTTRQK